MNALPTDYGPLVHELHRRAAACRQPLNGTFELTNRCNLGCRMCYVRNPAGDRGQRERELPVRAWLDLARHAEANGMVFLLLTGGEVFLRDDFFAIYEPLTRMGLMLTLFTNGTLITPAIAARLAQAPPSRTEITLYGATRATYEAVTGVPGSYAACCAGIENLVAHQIPLKLKTTITRQNVGELEAMRQMAHHWGVPFTAGWLLSRRRDGSPSGVDDCRLTAAECVALEAADRISAAEWGATARRDVTADSDANFYCQAGKSAFVVSPAGEMNACLDLPFPGVKPLETGFAAAWEEVGRFVAAAPPAAPECRDCRERVYCPRCPAWSYLENNTFTDPVPYLCEIARARKERYQHEPQL
jgi:radical SAM protein with 4Fe4S-binding SPASM domain